MITTVTLNVAIDKLYIVDEYKPYEVMRVQKCTYTPGGKGLNVTKVASLLQEEVTATGFVGGHAGEWILEALDKLGIKHQFVKGNNETRTCINIKELSTGRHTEFLEPGAPLTEEDEKVFLEVFERTIEKSKVVTISGSIPGGVSKDIYCKLVAICKKAGKKVLVDTSGELLTGVIEAKPTMIKPNIDELQAITKQDIHSIDDVIRVAKGLKDKGIEIVAVSLGKDGVLVLCEEGIYHGMPPSIEPINTVGCGDSMIAGFAVGLSREYSISDTIKMAVAVSAANALTNDTGYFKEEDYNELLNRVTINKL
ncbi:1-phosphofructokinase [Cellulosilyticum sp. I15G10I2]|uniref:1-phosphofructokinase n=1 Tax=Cellulosilyticum sp. I15G10I2 TaxID=1892843 RepID=UPI00085C61E1|nr:1-phosphofructokinase [Cellulosilyticum sp. I15G10I2]